MIVWLILGCAMRHSVRYEPVAFELPPPAPAFVSDLPLLLAADLQAGRLSAVTAQGAPASDEAALGELPPEVLYALYSMVRPWARGGELDLLVDVGDGLRPVTVRMGLDRSATLDWGTAPPVPLPPPAGFDVARWSETLEDKYGLAEVSSGNASWSLDELGDLAQGLSLLSVRERAAVSQLAIVRGLESPRQPARELAYFDPRTQPPRLEFFDRSFTEGQGGFVGPASAPLRPGVMTVLHEIGHALADLPLRRAYEAYLVAFEAWQFSGSEEDRSTMREHWRSYRRLGRRGPVLEEWERFRDGRLGPSSYGFRNPHESFAESFALAHLDPAALERALPGATAWFEAEQHVDAAGAGR